MPNLRGKSLMDAARILELGCGRPPLPTLYLRNYGHNPLTSTIWWLRTNQDWPAFGQGKFIIAEAKRFGYEFGVGCGLHLERGHKQPGNDASLEPNWKWHDFINDMHADVPRAVAAAAAIIKEPLDVTILASSGSLKFERVSLISSGPDLIFRNASRTNLVLSNCVSCTTWTELSRQLELLPSSADRHWIDVHIGVCVSLNPAGPDELPNCVNMLQCFQDWLGTS